MSRIGKQPVALPDGVTATLSGQTIEIKGPKDTKSFTATDDVTLTVEDGQVTTVSVQLDEKGGPFTSFVDRPDGER